MTGRPQNTTSDGIRKLLRLSLVRRQPSGVDGRSMMLHLRPKGRAQYKRMLPRLQARQERILGPLNATERKQLGKLLRKLVHAAKDSQQ